MDKKYVIALYIGTVNSKVVIFDKEARVVASSAKELSIYYPNLDWVEQDPMEILEVQKFLFEDVLEKAGISKSEIAAIGVANQRETTIMWDKGTGQPVYNAISWQCKRTAGICEELKENAMEGYIKRKTGLRVDAYFSGPKVKWILDNVNGARDKSEKGEVIFGTIDTWILWNLSGGKLHITDETNASRTMLYNIEKRDWDEKILDELEIPKKILPEVRSSSEIYTYIGEEKIPVASIMGDQQAALFGQTCFDMGEVESSYGVGSFFLMNTGEHMVKSKNGLLTTIAFSRNGKVDYALEGSTFVAGGLIQWLKDKLKIISDLSEVETLSGEVESSKGLYVIPSFSGLGAPYWGMYVKGAVVGLTYGSDRRNILRSALESIGYQTRDLLEAVEEDSGMKIGELKVSVEEEVISGELWLQILSDILGVPVKISEIGDAISLGVAYSAGLTVGFWKDKAELKKISRIKKEFKPSASQDEINEMYDGWKKAVGMLLKCGENL